MSGCLFCGIVSGDIPAEILYRDELCTIFADIHPQAPSHFLIIPNEHLVSLDDMTPDNAVRIGQLLERAATFARDRGLEREGYRLVTNCGRRAGQSVFHLHFHLLAGRDFLWPPG